MIKCGVKNLLLSSFTHLLIMVVAPPHWGKREFIYLYISDGFQLDTVLTEPTNKHSLLF